MLIKSPSRRSLLDASALTPPWSVTGFCFVVITREDNAETESGICQIPDPWRLSLAAP